MGRISVSKIEEAARLHLMERKSYSQIGAIMGMTKWQARDLVKAADCYLRGFAEGFKAAGSLKRSEG